MTELDAMEKLRNELAMKFFYCFIISILSIGCVDTKPKEDSKISEVKTEIQTKSEIEIKKERMKMVEIGNITPTGKFVDQDSTVKTISEFKGKLLIIDFWATWCSPCLKEAPIFKQLESKYENPKIEFLTISVDGEYKFWKEFVIENNWKTDNYWFGMREANPFFAYMYSEIEIEGENTILIALPKYVIIGPNGEILNNAAPKPSNPDFEIEIINLIKEYAT